jgi:hypothetical protein
VNVRLSKRTLSPSLSSQAVLRVSAGRVETRGGNTAIEPVRQLDLVLEDEKGKPLGLLAQLRDLLPGRYAFALTARNSNGSPLRPGAYVLQLVAWPTAGGEPTRVSVPFGVGAGGR